MDLHRLPCRYGVLGDAAMQPALAAIDRVFSAARKVATDPEAPQADRLAAVKNLGRGRDQQTEDLGLLAGLLVPRSPAELQLAALTALGRMNRVEVPKRLLAGWDGYGPAVRGAVLELVMSRPAWAHVLLDQVAADPALLAQIEPGRRAALTQHSDAKLAERATTVFQAGVDQNRQRVIDHYLLTVPALRGQTKQGGAVFVMACSACHQFGDVPGRLIGPDLAAVKDRSAGYLITHILDPNRALEERYILYTATTHDGRSLSGMLAGEASHSITLLGLDGAKQTLLRSEVRSLVSTKRSLMPDGLEAVINEQAMADLVSFLAAGESKNQGMPGKEVQ